MKRLVIFFLLSFTLFLLYRTTFAQNIALAKPYTIAPAPNLLYHPEVNKKLVLTDGKFSTGGYFWSQPTSLSWVKVPQVICTIDLGKIEVLSAVSFNTCRRVDSVFDVRYPSHIFIFTSNNNKYFEYVGDAALNAGNLPGPYQIKKFTLENIGRVARYVKVCVILSGLTLSCDEIEVMKGTHIQQGSLSGCSVGNIGKCVDSLISIYNMKNHLVKEGKILMNLSNNNADRLLFDQFISDGHSSAIFSVDFNRLKMRVQSLYLNDLKSRYKDSLLLYKTSPWDTLSTVSFPPSVAPLLDYKLVVPVSGHQYGSFVLINATNTVKTVYIIRDDRWIRSNSIELFHAHYVQAGEFRLIPDALIPVESDQFSIDPGIPELLIFKINGDSTGVETHHLTLRAGNIFKKINIKVETIRIDSFNGFKLNTNVWINTYHDMIRNRQEEAIQDLKKHNINVVEIGIGYLSPLNKPGFNALGHFLSSFPFAKTLLISSAFSSVNIREPDSLAPFMSFAWRSEFLKWYNILLQKIKNAGFSGSQAYFYPYDEVRGSDIIDFIRFATWIRDSVPRVKLYATISPKLFKNQDNLDKLISLLNIAQIAVASPIRLPPLPKQHGQIWIYENSSHSKEESAYSYYRLMAWDAYLNDVTGIGFWSYAGDPGHKYYTDPFKDNNLDHGVIYDGPGNSIISTRRWEAFSLGIEDYQILYLYGEKFGVSRAKFMARAVLDDKMNCKMADIVKDQMINNLEKGQ